MTDIIARLNAVILAYNEQPIGDSRRTDLHNLFLGMVAGLERGEWTRDELIELIDAAVADAKLPCGQAYTMDGHYLWRHGRALTWEEAHRDYETTRDGYVLWDDDGQAVRKQYPW
jgi:hypothetical protein